MLIINADDFGLTKLHTDRALECFRSGRISSATMMVFMEDTERAFSMAKKANFPLGLHFNLDALFTAPPVDDELIVNQRKLSRFFQFSDYSLLIYLFHRKDMFRKAFTSQYKEFCRIYQSQPSHIDSHHHLHISPNIIFNRILPEGMPIRRSLAFKPGEKLFINRWYRAFINWKISQRHPSTNGVYSLCDIIRKNRLEEIFRLAKTDNVELIVHPTDEDEYTFLMGDTFCSVTENVRLGTYSDLLK